MNIIAFDSHKRYTFARVENENGEHPQEFRIEHRRGNIAGFLSTQPPGSPVAIETIGNWYWIIDEIERAGMEPHLVHARKAKMMFGCINKTDKLDAKGLNILQRAGTLPTVWIPPAQVRDKRELPRTRMVFAVERTKLKNRIHSVIDKYGLQDVIHTIRPSCYWSSWIRPTRRSKPSRREWKGCSRKPSSTRSLKRCPA